jgi:hypothetical protein
MQIELESSHDRWTVRFYDRTIFSNLPMSGHTLKRVLAAAATYFILRWRLAPIPSEPAFALS